MPFTGFNSCFSNLLSMSFFIFCLCLFPFLALYSLFSYFNFLLFTLLYTLCSSPPCSSHCNILLIWPFSIPLCFSLLFRPVLFFTYIFPLPSSPISLSSVLSFCFSVPLIYSYPPALFVFITMLLILYFLFPSSQLLTSLLYCQPYYHVPST